MRIPFIKMQGAGNDYIFFDCLRSSASLADTLEKNAEMLAKELSDRHFSIGGDGIVLILRSDLADAKMRMFNADGSEGKMCGNAIRCVATHLYESGYTSSKELAIETISGIKRLKLDVEKYGGIHPYSADTRCERVKSVSVDMGWADFSPQAVPTLASHTLQYPLSVSVGGETCTIPATLVSVGNPHCVIFLDGVQDKLPYDIPFETLGAAIETHEIFPERTNVEFVTVLSPTLLKVCVWERGSGETLACGTGASAVVAAAVANGISPPDTEIEVKLKGGSLFVSYSGGNIILSGPAEIAFKGEIDI